MKSWNCHFVYTKARGFHEPRDGRFLLISMLPFGLKPWSCLVSVIWLLLECAAKLTAIHSSVCFFKQETWTVIKQFPCGSLCTHYWHKSSCGSGSVYAGYRPVSRGWAQRWGLKPTGPWVTFLCIFIMQRDIIHPAIQLQKVVLTG